MQGHSEAIRTRTAARGPWVFARHLAEMTVAMMLGMGVLAAALAVAGASLSEAPTAISAAGMGIAMTVPMVWWMRLRGHPSRHSVEMGASMIVPTAVVIVLYWLEAVPAHGVMMIEHSVMIPAMLLVMLLRYEHYSR
jgi:flagellar biosynthetic protein FliP